MSRRWIRKTFPQIMLWTGLLAFGGVVTLAQDVPAAAASQRTDAQIEMDVVKALDASTALKNDLITAATIQGEVTLSGTVSNEASKELAGSIVSHVSGVTKVHNNLQIGNPQQAAQQQNFPTGGNAAQPQTGSQEPAYTPAPDQNSAQGGYPPYPSPPQQQRPPYQNPNPQPYPGQNSGQYSAQQQPASEQTSAPVTIPAGTLLQLRTSEPVSSKHAAPGTPVQFTVIRDVNYGGVLAIPRGATVQGEVTEIQQAGQLGGSPKLALQLTSLDLGGKNYPVQSDLFKVKGPNKAGYTASNAVGGALVGAIIGAIAGRGSGAAIGAGVGAAAGTAASAATSGPDAWIPPEALVTFHLAAPLTVTPVSEQEAARLAQGLYRGGPNLYHRGGPYDHRPYRNGPRFAGPYGPYPPPYGPYGPYYGYPPVFYRPYYMVGGVYFWR